MLLLDLECLRLTNVFGILILIVLLQDGGLLCIVCLLGVLMFSSCVCVLVLLRSSWRFVLVFGFLEYVLFCLFLVLLFCGDSICDLSLFALHALYWFVMLFISDCVCLRWLGLGLFWVGGFRLFTVLVGGISKDV